ncbi:MAG: hypothetical protein NXI04_09785 [Planctomycetaceae bacterium]|nr:hypothetical protein [Planctomycetaceae bacterium]
MKPTLFCLVVSASLCAAFSVRGLRSAAHATGAQSGKQSGAQLAGRQTAVPASSGSQLETENAIRKVLSDQSMAWNSGDIPGFMDGYRKSSKLRFASGDSITFGWRPTLERYQKRYTDRDIMGRLEFRDLKILILSETYAEVFGSWHLSRKDKIGDASGLFTLLMQHTPDGWKVIHDHTSSAAKTPGEDNSTAGGSDSGAKKQPQ